MIVAFQMDAFSSLTIETDTTLHLAKEAKRRGLRLFSYQPQSLAFCHSGAHSFVVEGVMFDFDQEGSLIVGETLRLDLGNVDVILIRQNPPYDMSYIANTFILSLLLRKENAPLILNNPTSLRWMGEKFLPFLLKDTSLETLVTSSVDEALSFIHRVGDVVFKPPFEYGGRGVFLLSRSDVNVKPLIEWWGLRSNLPFFLQVFIPEVNELGDKRLLFIDGDYIGGFVRYPCYDSIRSNMRVGGHVVSWEASSQEEEILEEISTLLKKHDIFFAGVDLIGPHVTEINVTSPTGIKTLEDLSCCDIAALFWDRVLKKIETREQ